MLSMFFVSRNVVSCTYFVVEMRRSASWQLSKETVRENLILTDHLAFCSVAVLLNATKRTFVTILILRSDESH
jgi:hypothetical protein